ncbi:hypothetical protein KHA80_01500 [Anaerobacillus sp. HL2]|nr:hypothetical protein KHA80_01500 [Anaerobacillus sp. HL2]
MGYSDSVSACEVKNSHPFISVIGTGRYYKWFTYCKRILARFTVGVAGLFLKESPAMESTLE